MVHMIYFVVALLSLKSVDGSVEPFVVGGKKAAIAEFPHSAFIGVTFINSTGWITWICGASILNEKVILTAAHCIYGCGSSSMISVNMGHENRDKGTATMIKRYIIHKKYDPRTKGYDIGVGLMKSTIKFNDNIKRIAIMENPPYSEKATIAGWGLTNEITGTVDDYLNYVDQYVWKKKDCLKILTEIPNGTICASNNNAKTYASRGDSGSALVVRGYIQVGIVSFKVPSWSRSLVVYTDTGYFYRWIKRTTEKLHCYTNSTVK